MSEADYIDIINGTQLQVQRLQESFASIWVVVCTIVMFIMIPGTEKLYTGSMRVKRVLFGISAVWLAATTAAIHWAIFGFSLFFGPDIIGLFGAPSFFAVLDSHELLEGQIGISLLSYAGLQGMYFCVTAALIAGGVISKLKSVAVVFFVILWGTLVYCPLAHLLWTHNGLLSNLKATDFAGGAVVHLNTGITTIVAAMFLGQRIKEEDCTPHSIPEMWTGASFLVFGWFGFNCGAALGNINLVPSILVATLASGFAAHLTYQLADYAIGRKNEKGERVRLPSPLPNGLLAGFIAVTPACGVVTFLQGLAIGAITGVVCRALLVTFEIDKIRENFWRFDHLEIFALHGLNGAIGLVCTGIFTSNMSSQFITLLMTIAVSSTGTMLSLILLALMFHLYFFLYNTIAKTPKQTKHSKNKWKNFFAVLLSDHTTLGVPYYLEQNVDNPDSPENSENSDQDNPGNTGSIGNEYYNLHTITDND